MGKTGIKITFLNVLEGKEETALFSEDSNALWLASVIASFTSHGHVVTECTFVPYEEDVSK